MRRIFMLLAVVAAVMSCSVVADWVRLPLPRAGLPQGDEVKTRTSRDARLETRSIAIGSQERTYHVYTPTVARGGMTAPMALAFHGGGGNAQSFAERMELVEMAEQYGMILVLPEGLSRKGRGKGSWNAESMTPSGYAEKAGVDDIGFIDGILRDMSTSGAVDQSRVFAIGFSKGGMMAYRAACVLSGRFAAIAVVAATVSSEDCPGPDGISVLHVHGTDDRNVPFDGGQGEFSGQSANWPKVLRGLRFFSDANQCSSQRQKSQPAEDTLCRTVSCDGEKRVELCMVEGGGHAWPGSQPAKWQTRKNVYVSQKFDATEYIAQFLLSN